MKEKAKGVAEESSLKRRLMSVEACLRDSSNRLKCFRTTIQEVSNKIDKCRQIRTLLGHQAANADQQCITQAKNEYDVKKQTLLDEVKYANKDMDAAKKGLAESDETKAAAEGDLAVTTKALNEDATALAGLHQDCMAEAADFEAETTSRGEELKALAMATKAVKDTAAAGDLAVAIKAINEDVTALAGLHQDCMAEAADFEAETTSRGEE